MANAKKTIQNEVQITDIVEYMELLKPLSETERAQVKGIMIGLQIAKEKISSQKA